MRIRGWDFPPLKRVNHYVNISQIENIIYIRKFTIANILG